MEGNNIMQIVVSGLCTGCSACSSCEHISFAQNEKGFYAPVVDDKCNHCGKCLAECIYNPNRENDD